MSDGAAASGQDLGIDQEIGRDTSFEDEIEAMSSIGRTLESLKPDARERVLQWLVGRFVGTVPTSRARVAMPAPKPGEVALDQQSSGNQDDPDHFEDFADLYDAVNPSTAAERALVAGYWASRNKRDFRGQEVNALLKELGFGVGNITDALSTLMNRKPNEVMQTRKSGAARQSRKDYRLTKAGRDRLREMLSRVSEDE